MKTSFLIGLAFTASVISSCSKDKKFAVDTEDPIEVSACRATFKASGKNGDSKKITEKGFCFSTEGPPEYANNPTPSTNGFVDLFEAEVKGLKANTHYFVRAYTKLKSGGLVYGDVVEFSTNGVYMQGDTGPANGFIYSANPAASTGKFGECVVLSGTVAPWGCNGNELNSISLTGSGMNNTSIINSNCGPGTAANICYALTSGGVSDWYLPSAGELSLVQSFAKSNPELVPAIEYWSSSQWDANQANSINFATGGLWQNTSKTSNLAVIAVRSFN